MSLESCLFCDATLQIVPCRGQLIKSRRSIEGAIILTAACVPVLHPLYEVIYNRVKKRDAQGHQDLEHGQQDVEDNMGFWTRQIKAAIHSSRISATTNGTTRTGSSGQRSAVHTSTTRLPTAVHVAAREVREADMELKMIEPKVVFVYT